jgi:hypothetical protein
MRTHDIHAEVKPGEVRAVMRALSAAGIDRAGLVTRRIGEAGAGIAAAPEQLSLGRGWRDFRGFHGVSTSIP